MSFEAKYSGTCAQCDEMIRRGELIEYNFDNEIQHVVCPESREPTTGRPRQLCPLCSMELPVSGRCDCRY